MPGCQHRSLQDFNGGLHRMEVTGTRSTARKAAFDVQPPTGFFSPSAIQFA